MAKDFSLCECAILLLTLKKASARSVSASYAGFLYVKNKIAHSQSGKSFATLLTKGVGKCVT